MIDMRESQRKRRPKICSSPRHTLEDVLFPVVWDSRLVQFLLEAAEAGVDGLLGGALTGVSEKDGELGGKGERVGRVVGPHVPVEGSGEGLQGSDGVFQRERLLLLALDLSALGSVDEAGVESDDETVAQRMDHAEEGAGDFCFCLHWRVLRSSINEDRPQCL